MEEDFMRVFAGGYRGVSPVSVGIKIVTWKPISHVALINDREITIQSWHKGGTQQCDHPWTLHTPGTPIRIFALDYPLELHARVWARAVSKVGSKYDFRALLGFLPLLRRWWKDDPEKWFCSHALNNDCLLDEDHRLFNDQLPGYKVDPGLVVSSPRFRFLGEVVNRKELRKLIAG